MSPVEQRQMLLDHMALKTRKKQERKRRRSRHTKLRSQANKIVHSNRSKGSRVKIERAFLRELSKHKRNKLARRVLREY